MPWLSVLFLCVIQLMLGSVIHVNADVKSGSVPATSHESQSQLHNKNNDKEVKVARASANSANDASPSVSR